MLERETSREKNLEKAQKEARIRARKEAQRAADGVPSSADDSPNMQQVPTLYQRESFAGPLQAFPAACLRCLCWDGYPGARP